MSHNEQQLAKASHNHRNWVTINQNGQKTSMSNNEPH